MNLDAARAAVVEAEARFTTAHRAEGEAVAALADAAEEYGQEPTAMRASAWVAARDRRELARIAVTGAEKRLGAARAQLTEAERDDARGRLADAKRRADRAALFQAVAASVERLAALNAIPAPDALDLAVDDERVVTAIADHADRQVERAMAMRAVRRAIDAQHAAVNEGLAAALDAESGTFPDHYVPMEHVLALVEAEKMILTGVITIDWARTWSRQFRAPGELFVSNLGSIHDNEMSELERLRGEPQWLAMFARVAAVSGSVGLAINKVLDAALPAEREEERQRLAAQRREMAAQFQPPRSWVEQTTVGQA